MRLISNTTFVLMALLFTYGCSQKGTNVKLEVSNNFVFGGAGTAAIAGGGLMVWGQNSTTGASFGKALEDTDEINVPLPNGAWTFYAMAWDGTTDYQNNAITNHVFGGTVRCAISSAFLDGKAAAVNLTVNNANCSDPVFAGTIGTTGTAPNLKVPAARFNFCRGMFSISGPAQLCTDSKLDNRQRVRKSTVSSFRVTLKNHYSLSGGRNLGAEGLKGQCVTFYGDIDAASQGGEIVSHSSKYGRATIAVPGLPAGGPGLPFHTEVEMYLSADCDANAISARGVFKKELPNGITSQDNISNRYFVDGNFHRQYLTLLADDVCTGRTATTLGGHPFAGGDGTRDNPYIICSVPQFHAINSNPAYMTASFKLSADLDFNPYSVGLTANAVPAVFACLEPGSNFMPIGYVAASCNAATKVMTWNTYTSFSGTFDGGNFTIKNLRLREDSIDHVGIFAKLYSTLKDYGNFHVEKAEFEGSQFVGLLAGEVASSGAGSNQMELWSITAKDVDIQARGNSAQSNVGGLVGHMENGNLFRVNFLKSRVRGDGSRVGGIIGSTINVLLKEVAAEVDIENKSQVTGKLDIGGVVGLANNTDFHYVKHEGGIYTDAHQVGGIVGSTVLNSTLQNFYTNSHIVTNSSNVNPKLGGVIGSWNSVASSSVGPGYSLSKVKSDCPTACQQGGIVGEILTAPSVKNPMYRLSNLEAGDGDAPTNFSTNEVPLTSIAEMRDITFVTSLVADTSGEYNWEIVDGEYPRFDFEGHPCVNGFSGAGATTIASPKLICNEAQYLTMSSATSTNFYKLIANIRFPENSADNDIAIFNGHLNGNGQALIAGGITPNVNSGLGHIGTLNGSIRNLKVLGMSREGNVGTPATPHGTIVAVNNGTLENIVAHTYSKYFDMGAGVVGHNTMTGQMKRIRFEGVVKGQDNLTTLAYQNEGLIEDSKASGEIKCTASTSCNYIAGLAIQNQGRIKRTEMSVRVSEPSTGMINFASMLVDTNEYLSVLKPGILQDILVPDHAEFRVTGTDAAYFHRQNLTGASLERIAHFGKLLFDDPTYSTFTLVQANFPSETDAINPDGGSHTDVRRSGGRSGKLLVDGANFTCPTTSIARVPDWSVMPDFANWNSNLGPTAYTALASANKHLVIELDLGGATFTQKVVGYSNGASNYDFTIPTAQCTGSGKATIYYTNDLAIDDSGNGVSGTMLTQSASQAVNYGGPWQANMYDSSIPADNAALFAYYGFLLGVTTTPMTPRIWELSEDYPTLFNND